MPRGYKRRKKYGLVGSSNSGPLIATALSKFADIFSEGLREWKQMPSNNFGGDMRICTQCPALKSWNQDYH
jgi:hypothetical protein